MANKVRTLATVMVASHSGDPDWAVELKADGAVYCPCLGWRFSKLNAYGRKHCRHTDDPEVARVARGLRAAVAA